MADNDLFMNLIDDALAGPIALEWDELHVEESAGASMPPPVTAPVKLKEQPLFVRGMRGVANPEASAQAHAQTPGPSFNEFARLGGKEYVDRSANEYRLAREGKFWAHMVDSRVINNDAFDEPTVNRPVEIGNILLWVRLGRGSLQPTPGSPLEMYHINTQVLVTGRVEKSMFYQGYRSGYVVLRGTKSHGAVADPTKFEDWLASKIGARLHHGASEDDDPPRL